jgi:DNA-binding PadR family transcriptional regulator
MRGPFEHGVLLTIVRLGPRAYGQPIRTELRARLRRQVSAGAVYATLRRLEAKGLVSSRLTKAAGFRGGPRRYFVLTRAGIRAVNEAKQAMDRLWRGLRWPLTGRR